MKAADTLGRWRCSLCSEHGRGGVRAFENHLVVSHWGPHPADPDRDPDWVDDDLVYDDEPDDEEPVRAVVDVDTKGLT